jgi:hypothetical protein
MRVHKSARLLVRAMVRTLVRALVGITVYDCPRTIVAYRIQPV